LQQIDWLGVPMVRQRESGKTIENGCLLGAPVTEVNPPSFEHINQVSEVRLAEIEHFFVWYNAAHGRKFTPTGRGGPKGATDAWRLAQEQ
jgi:inorganic pyrophosphatase